MIGAILAFYFGSKNLEKAHELVEKYPEAKMLSQLITMIQCMRIIEKVKPSSNKIWTTLILKENKPFGMFYRLHLLNIYENLNGIIKQGKKSNSIPLKKSS